MGKITKNIENQAKELDGQVEGDYKKMTDAYNKQMAPTYNAWINSPEVKAVDAQFKSYENSKEAKEIRDIAGRMG